MKPMQNGADKLKSSLLGIGKAANNIDTTTLANNVEAISGRFSNLGIIGQAMLQKVGWAVADLGFALKNKLMAPLSIIKQKGLSRALDIEQAQFQIKGLGLDVQEVMKNANDAVSGTAYGLNEAAKAASVLGASGIKAGEEMEQVLTSIAGAAAMTGRNYADIADIYGTVASNGRLMTQQLRQFSASGLNVSAVLAKHFNKTEEEINEMVSKGKVSFKEFSEAMMSFGEHAKAANDTFSGSLSNMKAALGRIGASFYQPMLVHARDVFNAITPAIDNVHNALKPLFKYMDTVAGAVTEKFTAKLRDLTSHLNVIERVGKFKFGDSWQAWTGVLKNTDTSLKITMDDIDSLGKKADETWTKLSEHFKKSDSEVKKMVKSGKVSYADYAEATGKAMKMTLDDVGNLQKKGIPSWTMLTRSLVEGCADIEKAYEKGEISQKDFSKAMQKANSEIEEKLKKGKISWADYTKATEDAKLSLIDLENIAVESGIDPIELLSKSLDKSKEDIKSLAEEGKISFADLSKAMEKVAKNSLTDGSLSIEDTIKALNIGFVVRNMEQFKTILQAGKDVAILFKDALFGLFDVLSGGGGESALQAAAATLVHFVAFLSKGVSKAIEFGRASGAFQKVHDALLGINDFLFGAIEALNHYAKVVWDFIKRTGVLNSIFEALGASTKFVSKHISEIFGSFTNIGGKALAKAGEAFGVITEAIGKLKAKAGGVKDILDPILEVFTKIANAGTGVLATAVHQLFDAFSGGISNLTNAVGTGALAMALFNLWSVLSRFGKKAMQQGLIASLIGGNTWSVIRDKLWDMDRWLGIFHGTVVNVMKGNLIFKLAIALGILALSCKTLAGIDQGRLNDSILAIASIMTFMSVLGPKMSAINTKGFITFSIAILLLSSAVKKLSELSNMTSGLVGVGVLMAELTAIAWAFNKLSLTSKGLAKAGIGFIFIAEALNIMSKPVARLAQFDVGDLAKGLISAGILMKGLIHFMLYVSYLPMKNALAASFSMTVMALALTAMVAPIALLGNLQLPTLVQGMAALVVLMAALTGMLVAVGRFGKNAWTIGSIGAAVTGVAKAIDIMVPGIAALGMLPIAKLIKGIGAVVVLLAAFAGFGVVMAKFIYAAPMMLVAAGALLITSIAINGIALAIAALGNTDHVWKGIGALAVALITLAVGVTAMTFAAIGAPVLLVVAAALVVLAPAIALLSGLPFLGIVGGMLGLAIALGIFAGAACLLLPAMPAMLALSGVVLAIGIGFAALGTGVTLIAVAFASGIGVIVEGCEQVAIALPILAQGVNDFIGVLLDGIVQNMPKIGAAMSAILLLLLSVGYRYIPQIIRFGLIIIIKLLEGIRSKIEDITNIAIDIVLLFIDAISSRSKDIIDAGFNLIVNFINGLANSVSENGPILVASINNLILSLVEVFIGAIPGIGNAGAEAIRKYREGLASGAADSKRAAQETSKVVEENLKVSDAAKQNVEKGMKDVSASVEKGGQEATQKAKRASSDTDAALEIPSQYSNGYNAVRGLVSGMDSQIPSLRSKSNQIASIVNDTIAKKNEIHSPSRLLARTGKYLIQGLIAGVDSLTPQYQRRADNIATTMIQSTNQAMAAMDALSSPMNLSGAISQSTDVNLRMNDIRRENDRLAQGLTNLTNALTGVTDTMNSRSLNNYINIDGSSNPELFADELLRSFKLNARTV